MLKEFIFHNFSVKSKKEFRYLPEYKAKEWEECSDKEYFLQQAKEICAEPIPELTATMFLDFYKTGSREGYESNQGQRRTKLLTLIAAQITNPEEDFIPEMIDYVWAICEETSWTPPSHNNHYYTHYPERVNLPRFDAERTYVDLISGFTGAMLALVYYFFEKELEEYSPLLNQRIIQRVRDRVVLPILNYDDFGWMGLSAEGRINNWNPWIVYNGLFAAMCLPLEQQKRRLYINKTLLLLEQFVNYYFPDGGCDEGPDYFFHAAGCLVSCLDLLSYVTEGQVSLLDNPLIRNIGQYIERAAVFDNQMAAFGDSQPIQNNGGVIIYFLGKVLKSESLLQYGLRRFELEPENSTKLISNAYPQLQMVKLLLYPEMKQQLPSRYEHQRTCFMKDTMILTCRQLPKDCTGFSLAAKGGHNNESHNHNDVGQVIVCLDKKPVIVDPGNTVYTAKTFSPQRYEIPNMQSGCHNLPTVNGYMQKDGKEYGAKHLDFQDSPEKTVLSYEIGKAYPPEAGITSLKRTSTLDREQGIVTVQDDFSVRKGEIVWNLMVYGEPEIEGNQIKTISGCVITAQGLSLEIDSAYAQELDQIRMKANWKEPLYHVTLKGTDLSVGTLTLLFQKGC